MQMLLRCDITMASTVLCVEHDGPSLASALRLVDVSHYRLIRATNPHSAVAALHTFPGISAILMPAASRDQAVGHLQLAAALELAKPNLPKLMLGPVMATALQSHALHLHYSDSILALSKELQRLSRAYREEAAQLLSALDGQVQELSTVLERSHELRARALELVPLDTRLARLLDAALGSPPADDGTARSAPDSQTNSVVSGPRKTVLVIDDEAAIRNVLRELLQSSGYPVITASDGQSGVDIFRNLHPSIALVILDMVMPGIGGRETYALLRQINADCPVLVCTGYSDSADLQQMRQHGIAGVLPKPVRLTVLRETVASLIGRPRSDK